MDNAKDELKNGVTAGFEQDILNQSFKEFAELHYIFTGEDLGVMQFMQYRDWLGNMENNKPQLETKKQATPF